MSEPEKIVAFACGPSQGECVCRCPESCDHVWDGPSIEACMGATSTCSKCGKPAMAHDLMVLP